MLAVKIVIAIIACALIACVLHYFFTAGLNPKRFVEITSGRNIPIRRWAYFWAVIIGGGFILFAGFDTLLAWMPLSFGSYDEDGGFNPIRHTIAGLLTVLVFPLLDYMEKSARREVAFEELRQRIIELERELAHAKRNSSAAT